MAIRNTYTEWVQVDRKGQDVPATNRFFKRAPRTGRWRKLTSLPCCSAFSLTYTPPDVTDDTFDVTIICDATNLVVARVVAAAPTTTIQEVVALLRKQAGYIGKWATDGTVIELQLSPAIALNCADAADLSFTVATA